jgi:hypothetical protein
VARALRCPPITLVRWRPGLNRTTAGISAQNASSLRVTDSTTAADGVGNLDAVEALLGVVVEGELRGLILLTLLARHPPRELVRLEWGQVVPLVEQLAY